MTRGKGKYRDWNEQVQFREFGGHTSIINKHVILGNGCDYACQNYGFRKLKEAIRYTVFIPVVY